LDGLEAGVDAVGSAHVVGPAAPFQGGAAREWCGFAGRPAAEAVAKAPRLWLRKPWPNLWHVVLEGTRQAVRATDFGTDEAPAVCDAWSAGTQGGAWGLQGLELVTGCEEEVDRECRSGGVVWGSAGGKRCAVLGHGERLDGQEPEEIRLAPCRHAGPFLELQAHRARVSGASRAQGLAPRIDGFRAVCEAQERTPCSASGW
jgi:hypothetical protein